MKYFFVVLQIELQKIQRAKIVWIIAAAFTIAPVMAGFFMFVLKDPSFAENSGLLGAQAQIAGEANWEAYLNLHAQMISVGGILVFGILTSWVFGREYTDGTIKDLLVLPYSRTTIVVAKFVAATVTNLLLSLYIITFGLFLGFIITLPGGSLDVMKEAFFTLTIVTILTVILSLPVAFFASYSRGYLAPLGFVIIMVVLSQMIGAIGYGEYFPWAIPSLYSGLTGEKIFNSLGLLITIIVSILGFMGTLYWWIYADQHE